MKKIFLTFRSFCTNNIVKIRKNPACIESPWLMVCISSFFVLLFGTVFLQAKGKFARLQERENRLERIARRLRQQRIDADSLSSIDHAGVLSEMARSMRSALSESTLHRKLIRHPAFISCPWFAKENPPLTFALQGGEYVQTAPYAIDGEDLERFLVTLEEVRIGPHAPPLRRSGLIIKQFDLVRTHSEENPRYLIETKLCERCM